MAPCSSKNLQTKEVKIPHLIVANLKKMETWGLVGLFAADWNGTYDNLVEELAERKVFVPKYEYRGKPEEWSADIWREVYNLPKANLGGYTMKGKVQIIELQLLRVVKGDRWQSKSMVFLEQVEGNSEFVLFCKMLNAVFTPVKPEYFQHNLLAFYHHAWAAITNPTAPTPDWSDAIEKTVTRQIKALGVCNEATCIWPYLVHLYSHFHEMDAKEKEDSKKCEASGSKLLDQKINYADWGIYLENLGRETSKLFEAFHVEIGSVTVEAMARNMKEMFAPPPIAEADIKPWKEMVKNLARLLTEKQKRNKVIIEQCNYFKGKTRYSEKIQR
ncbi:hypothetical protein R1flu_029033 [Riccia fluitans]|uniref:Uncharacterized protein n=1 Tax=Riccia fluitans TaxID=41844 RepID=A0ABD1XNC8_9MARC